MPRSANIITAFAALLLANAAGAGIQTASQAQPDISASQTTPDAEQNPAEVQQTQALNARYEAELAAANAARAEYDRAYAVWEGLVRACEASGRTDCRVNAPR